MSLLKRKKKEKKKRKEEKRKESYMMSEISLVFVLYNSISTQKLLPRRMSNML